MKRSFLSALTASLAGAGFIGLALSVPVAGAANDQPPRMHQLKITVVDATTKQPVVGAEVSVQDGREPVKFTTDAAGLVVLPVRLDVPSPEKVTKFSFQVTDPRYETRSVEWFADAGHVRADLPAAYTVALPTGIAVSGVVRDERGAPVPGAKVMVYASGLKGRRLGRGDKLQQEYGSAYLGEEQALVTDEKGAWRLEHFPSDVTQFSIDIIRPGGGRARFIAGTMYRGPAERSGTVDLAQLRNYSAVFTLKDGVTLRGIVVDEAGKPVTGVQLKARDTATRNQPDSFTNRSDGTFELVHWDAAAVLVTAERGGYQAKSITIEAEGDTGSGRIVLSPAKPLVLRVLGENDTPLADLDIMSDPTPSPDHIVAWKAKTDATGRVEWPTAPDVPMNIWINAWTTPSAQNPYPVRIARVTADGTEQVVRLRRGADKEVRVRLRVVDAETGAPVRSFEVWRRLANQAFKTWGEPAEKGEFTKVMAIGDMPNGFVAAYRLQVRAAGYAGWSSETLDFSNGDQDVTIKMAKGPSTLANEPPPTRSAGTGIDAVRNAPLMVLGARVGQLLETGDVAAFVRETNGSLEDWKRLLPAGVDPKEVPLGANPARTIERREKAITASALHVLEQARRAGVTPGRVKFTVKFVTSPMNSSSIYKFAGQEVKVPFAMALHVVLAGEPVGAAGGKSLRGDYALSIGNARQFPGGWRTEDGVRWAGFPSGLADEALQRELALANKSAPATFADNRTLSGADDAALLALGEAVTGLVRTRAAAGFVGAATPSREDLEGIYTRFGWGSTADANEERERVTSGLTLATQAMLALQERIGVDLSDAKLTVKQVLADRPHFTRFGQLDGLRAGPVRVMFAVESAQKAKSGQALSGNYTVALGDAVRVNDRWQLLADKIRFQDIPKGVVAEDELKHVEFENYVADHHTLPPGYAAPDVAFTKLADGAPLKLAAYRGKVVILEFWAVWCGPCQEPMEKLQHLLADHPEWKDRVEVIALSIDDKAAEPTSHLEKKGWSKTFNVWAGPGGWQAEAPKAFRVRGVPTAYVLDRDGKVVKAGHPMAMDFAQIVAAELKKNP